MSKALKPVVRAVAPAGRFLQDTILPHTGFFGASAGSLMSGDSLGTAFNKGLTSAGQTAATLGALSTGGALGGGGGLSSILGTKAGTPLAGGVGPTAGSGILGGVTRGLSNIGLGNLSSTFGNSAGGSMFGGNPLSSIMGGYLQNRGAEKQKDAIIEQLARGQAEYAPYKESGLAANRRLTEMLGSGELGGRYTAEDFEADPGYQFRLGEGNRLLNQRLAAGGNFFSGDALRAAQDYGQQAASQEYQNAFNRNLSEEQQIYNMLYGQQGVGANAARNLDDLYRQEAATRSGAYAAKTDALSRMLGGF